MSRQTREPIISVLGHVDHGKTSVLDWIRKSVVASGEAGGITQHIGATDIPFDIIKDICGNQLSEAMLKLPLRGLLFIDTPGHESFTTLRKRGGSVADIAILVIDIKEGVMPQTKESIEILKQQKTPFIIAVNKLDTLSGWQKDVKIEEQHDIAKNQFWDLYYKLIADFGNIELNCNLYNQINDFTQEVAIVPVSAITGEGIPSLLTVLIGLIQAYLKDNLDVGLTTPAKGTILEVKETKGLGTTIDAIIYEGTIKVNDPIAVGGHPPFVSRVKALLRPQAMDEMRDPKKKFNTVNEVYAASGVKIVAQGLDCAMAGTPIYVGSEEKLVEIKSELEEIEFVKDTLGVVVKADTLGSLEALVKILSDKKIPIKKASIGKVNKQDVIETAAVSERDKYHGVLLAFNSSILEDAKRIAKDKETPIFSSKVVYRLLEEYEIWLKETKNRDKKAASSTVVFPSKFKYLPGCTFRQSKPAVFGVEILGGVLHKGTRFMKADGKIIGYVKELQDEGKSIPKAEKDMQIAVAVDRITLGRQIEEGDTLYSVVSLEDVEKLKKLDLSDEEKKILKEIIDIRKKK